MKQFLVGSYALGTSFGSYALGTSTANGGDPTGIGLTVGDPTGIGLGLTAGDRDCS